MNIIDVKWLKIINSLVRETLFEQQEFWLEREIAKPKSNGIKIEREGNIKASVHSEKKKELGLFY